MSLVYDLMWRVRKFTRTTLLHQHASSQYIGLHATDAKCIDKEELEFLVKHTEALTEIYNQQVTNINKS
jgi:hypothetical protein